MPIVICHKCFKPCPDSFYDFKKICTCLTKQEWIKRYKKNKWLLKLDGKTYDYTTLNQTIK